MIAICIANYTRHCSMSQLRLPQVLDRIRLPTNHTSSASAHEMNFHSNLKAVKPAVTTLWNRNSKLKQNLHGPQREDSAQVLILNPKMRTEGKKKCRAPPTCYTLNGTDRTLEITKPWKRQLQTEEHTRILKLKTKTEERRRTATQW